MKRSQFFYRMSLVVFSLAALIVLGLPTSQALVIVPAPNDRCGPKAGGGACTAVGALDVPQATAPGTQVRQCYEFDISNATEGPVGVDVRDGPGGFPNDVWFRLAISVSPRPASQVPPTPSQESFTIIPTGPHSLRVTRLQSCSLTPDILDMTIHTRRRAHPNGCFLPERLWRSLPLFGGAKQSPTNSSNL